MDRNREARRAAMPAPNGLSRRRHKTSSLRDSPDEDGPVELQETARLRDRGSGKKDRDRERDRDRLSRSKRRRDNRLIHGNHRDDGGEDTSEESVNDEEEDDDDNGGGGSVRMLPPNPLTLSSSSLLTHRKSYPPAKVFRVAPTWKAADEMIGVSVPRKARSASTKRSHECWASSGGIVGDHIYRQASTSPVRPSVSAAAMVRAPSPASPSSSSASMRKKIKPNRPKLRPPKCSSKSVSSAQDEIEIEIAEVLYGMMRQPQGPLKQEIMANDSMKFDSREVNKSSVDAKSRLSSPISNSQLAQPLSSSILPQNSNSPVTHISAVAPKRKRPRPVKYDEENPSIFTVRSSTISPTTKAESDQPSKVETCSPNLEKISGSAPENGSGSSDLVNCQAVPVSSETMPESIKLERDSKMVTEDSGSRDVGVGKEEPLSPTKESPAILDNSPASKANLISSGIENQREEKFQIDLMAPPPQVRSSPDRDGESDFVAVDPEPMILDTDMEIKPVIKEDEKTVKISKEVVVAVETEKVRAIAAEAETKKSAVVHKERNIDLHLDLERADRDNGPGSIGGKKLLQSLQHQQPNTEKNAQSNSVTVPLSVPSWPGGLPPMGYMAPLQGVVSMDGTTVSSAAIPPPHLLFNQPRPKRCATHCYIARNICYIQQIARMNPFWPTAAGIQPLYKRRGTVFQYFLVILGRRKVLKLLTWSMVLRGSKFCFSKLYPQEQPSNILHGPALFFPLNQQQAAAAASVQPGSIKSSTTSGTVTSSCTSNTTSVNPSATGAAAAPTMSFSYPNVPGNETQYLAILQNNAYPFPIPAHVGAPPAYRGTHTQALPIFNGSFYSSQMLHPSQLQQQQLPAQSQQSQQGHQNTSISTGSSSSQKHLQNQQQRPNTNGSNGDSPSTADSRISRATMNIYGQNFAMQMQPPNFALMTPAAISGASASVNHGEKKQQPFSKTGVEASQAFAMSFAALNGATAAPALDLSSIAQNHQILQSHGYQMMAAAAASQAAQHKKSYRLPEEGKPGGADSSIPDEERKAMAVKIPATMGQSIAFSRSDVNDPSISTVPGNNVIDSSARSVNHGAATSRASSSVLPPANSTFSNTVSAFPQNLVQSNSSPAQSPQWKNSVRAATSQAPPSSMASTPSSSIKTPAQQQARPQQTHTQISFAANPKSSTTAQVQPSGSNQSASPIMVGSPTTSSMSKSAGGSPRTTSTSTSNKVGQASLSSQQAKNSPSMPSRKSSPVSGRNVQSTIGCSPMTPSSNIGTKPQLQQQQQQQISMSKQNLQEAQLFFSNAYMHAQAAQSNSSNSAAAAAASGYYLQRRRPEQQQPQGSSGVSSNGMLSLCPSVTLANTSTSDSLKVVAAAAGNMKGGSLASQGLLHPPQFAAAQSSGNPHQFVHAGFPYVHTVPTAVQVKQAEQKQPAFE
ncbi:Protein TIME FOR COFFEE [Quillaja saponaria]|uniref:Protein TIME FOR COFFEE n=1 Tax=Quillaja saponaria TaxID=32244 RepID=A0AAD7PHE1_QUISA|nr:Protein TIME FOR COFFEE [Quillaja saponaria]